MATLFFFGVLIAVGVVGLLLMRRAQGYIPTLTLVWFAHIVFFGSGVIRGLLTGTDDLCYDLASGTRVPVSREEYQTAMYLVGLGLLSLLVGYFLHPRPRESKAAAFLSARISSLADIKKWGYIFMALALMQYIAVGVTNPLELIRLFSYARAARPEESVLDNLTGFGTSYAFLTVWGVLGFVAVGITVYLCWRRVYDLGLIACSLFLMLLALLSGTRQMLLSYLLPIFVFSRYVGRGRAFVITLLIGAVGLPFVAGIQLYARTGGFGKLNFSQTLTEVRVDEAMGGSELVQTAAVVQRYPVLTDYLQGRSYLALLVAPVPRVWWPGKPAGFGFENGISLGYVHNVVTVSAGWVGEAYANGGWWVIPVVGVIAGFLMRTIDNLLVNATPIVTVVLVYVQTRVAFWIRGDTMATLGPAMFTLILVFGLTWLGGWLLKSRGNTVDVAA